MNDTSELVDQVPNGEKPLSRTSTQLDTLKVLLKAPETLDELDVPPAVVLDIIFRVLFHEGQVNVRRLATSPTWS